MQIMGGEIIESLSEKIEREATARGMARVTHLSGGSKNLLKICAFLGTILVASRLAQYLYFC